MSPKLYLFKLRISLYFSVINHFVMITRIYHKIQTAYPYLFNYICTGYLTPTFVFSARHSEMFSLQSIMMSPSHILVLSSKSNHDWSIFLTVK